MSEPFVSCIVPAYNYGRFLPAAIDSALEQDWPADRLEIIVVDDGSTDDTPDVLTRYAGAIQVITQPNAGANAANATGIAAARGDFITFLDADDVWPVGRVRALVRALEAHPEAGLAYGDMALIDADGVLRQTSVRGSSGMPAPSGQVLGALVRRNFISGGAMMVRSALRDRFHPFPAHAGWHDWWIALNVARVADVVAIPDVVNLYRLHGANQNANASLDQQANLAAESAPLRRWVATNADPAAALADLVAALDALDSETAALARYRGLDVAAIHAIGDHDRVLRLEAMHAASAALDEQRPEDALRHLIRAAGHDPTDQHSRELIRQLWAVIAPPEGYRVAAAH